MKRNSEEFLNKTFNRLTVMDFIGRKYRKDGKKYDNWYKCLCECGNYKEVTYSGLKRGDTKSCGCLSRENSIEKMKIEQNGKTLRLLKKK